MMRAPLRRVLLVFAVLGGLALSGCGASKSAVAAGGSAGQATAKREPVLRVVPEGQPRDWRDEIIYFVMTDRFFDGDPSNNKDVDRTHKGSFHGGDFAGLRKKLDYIAELGTTALWITPIVDQVDEPVHGAGFPDWAYHGYWAEDFEEVEERLGSLEELQGLVRDAHARGIKVLIDVVINHPGYGSHWVDDGKWVRSTELETCKETDDDVIKCLLGLPDFRTEDPEVAKQLIEWQVAWIDRTGCDGFRVDTVKHVEHSVWKQFRKRIHERHPDFFLLGEVWGATMHEAYASEYMGDQMDSLVDFGFHGAVEGFVEGRGRPGAFAHYLRKRHSFADRMVLAHYLDSHDERTFFDRVRKDEAKMRMAALLQMTTIGIPIITWGNEVGRVGGEWPFNRSDMLWGKDQNRSLLAYYRQLIKLRKTHKALSRGTFAKLSDSKDSLAFLRYWAEGDDAVIVGVNRGSLGKKSKLEIPEALRGVLAWKDALHETSSPVMAQDGAIQVRIPPEDSIVLLPVRKP